MVAELILGYIKYWEILWKKRIEMRDGIVLKNVSYCFTCILFAGGSCWLVPQFKTDFRNRGVLVSALCLCLFTNLSNRSFAVFAFLFCGRLEWPKNHSYLRYNHCLKAFHAQSWILILIMGLRCAHVVGLRLHIFKFVPIAKHKTSYYWY